MGKHNTRGANKIIQRNVGMKENCPNAGPDVEISTNKENKRGRKISKTPVEFEKESKRLKKTNKSHDTYCWKCKKIESDIECLPEVECSTCVRAFHTSCIKVTKINKDKICYVCQQSIKINDKSINQQSDAKATSNIDEIFLSKLLLHIIDTACPMDKAEYKPLVDWIDSEENEKLINIKDLCLIRDKCIQYESHVELVDDLEWIHHNCVIVYGDKSPIATNAKKILLKVQRMLKDALDCPECYYKKIGNDKLTFLSICKTPHPLVWAKVKGYKYWPAKCLKASKDKANVRFFHTHQMASVPLSNVLAMSEKYPSSSKPLDKKSKNGFDFLMAMAELKAYIDRFIVYYDKFPFAKENTPFNFEEGVRRIKDLTDKTPHPLVWAKVKGYSYWPAKCLTASEGKANVKYFHTHQMASVPLSNVLAMSEKYPSRFTPFDKNTKNGVDFLTAKDELKANIDIFIGHYGKFPFAPVDTPFNFEKEVRRMKELTDDVSADTFPLSPTHEPRSYLPDVNNTEDAEDQTHQKENVAPIIHHALETNIFGNPKDLQAFHHAISGSLLPSQTSDHNNMNWLTQGISISNVISGTDAPSNAELLAEIDCETEHSLQNTNFSMSMPSAESDIFQSTPVLNQSSMSSSSTEICLRSVNNYGCAPEAGNFVTGVYPSNTFLEDDGDIEFIEEITPSNIKRSKPDIDLVLQSILKYDPRSYDMLKKANALVKELFIQFWGTTALNQPERIIQSQADEIQLLRQQNAELKQELACIKNEKMPEKLNNAGNIVRILRGQVKNLEEQRKREAEKHDQDIKRLQQDIERLTEEIKKQKRENEKLIEDFEKHFEKQQRLLNEIIRETKTNKYCDIVECLQLAKHLCCYSGVRAYSYCSEKCKALDDVHRRTVCKSVRRTDPQQLPEEREDPASDQVVARELLQKHSTISSITYTYASITNKEITSSSVSPQTSSANIQQAKKKVVTAKKTFEAAKNINRSNNADIF